jgi:uncharacterized protein (DUF433 family)
MDVPRGAERPAVRDHLAGFSTLCRQTLLRRPENDANLFTMNYQDIIAIEPGKRGGRPCIRHMRIAVADVLGWLAAGQTHQQILEDFPELTEDDIRACLAYAADRERRLITAST